MPTCCSTVPMFRLQQCLARAGATLRLLLTQGVLTNACMIACCRILCRVFFVICLVRGMIKIRLGVTCDQAPAITQTWLHTSVLLLP